MDTEIVVDSSVVLACLHGEPGSDRVRDLLSRALICAVNLGEVAGKLFEADWSGDEVRTMLDGLGLHVAPVDFELAFAAGALRPLTRHLGLSLADRFCLALGASRRLPVYTADRAWARFSSDVEVRLIR